MLLCHDPAAGGSWHCQVHVLVRHARVCEACMWVCTLCASGRPVASAAVCRSACVHVCACARACPGCFRARSSGESMWLTWLTPRSRAHPPGGAGHMRMGAPLTRVMCSALAPLHNTGGRDLRHPPEGAAPVHRLWPGQSPHLCGGQPAPAHQEERHHQAAGVGAHRLRVLDRVGEGARCSVLTVRDSCVWACARATYGRPLCAEHVAQRPAAQTKEGWG